MKKFHIFVYKFRRIGIIPYYAVPLIDYYNKLYTIRHFITYCFKINIIQYWSCRCTVINIRINGFYFSKQMLLYFFNNVFLIIILKWRYIKMYCIILIQMCFKIFWFWYFKIWKQFLWITSAAVIGFQHTCRLRFSETAGMAYWNTVFFFIKKFVCYVYKSGFVDIYFTFSVLTKSFISRIKIDSHFSFSLLYDFLRSLSFKLYYIFTFLTTAKRIWFFQKSSCDSRPNENVAPSAQLQNELTSSFFL